MKKFYKICGLIFGLILLIGLILLVVFRLNDNPLHDYNGKHTHYNASKTFYVKKFDSIKLACYRPDIRISLKDINKFKVVVRGGHGADIKKIKTNVANNQLTISDQPEHHYNDGYYAVDIYIPAKNAVKKITGFCEEGDFYINSLNVPRINLTIEDGDVLLNKLTAKSLDLKSNDGDLKVNQSTFSRSSLSLNDGDAKISDSQILGNSSVMLNDGDFLMSNAPKINYVLTNHSDDKIMFKGSHHSNHFAKKVKNKPVLKVTSMDGDILIN